MKYTRLKQLSKKRWSKIRKNPLRSAQMSAIKNTMDLNFDLLIQDNLNNVKELMIEPNNQTKSQSDNSSDNLIEISVLNSSQHGQSSEEEYQPSHSESDSYDSDYDTTSDIVNLFKDAGLYNYLISRIGGRRSHQAAISELMFLVNFLKWTYQEKYKRHLQSQDTMHWFGSVITIEYMLLENFVDGYLLTIKNQSPLTVKNKLYILANMIKWFVDYRSDQTNKIQIQDTRCFMDLSNAIRKDSNKTHKRMNGDKNEISKLVYERQLPQHGLQELYQCCYAQMNWARSVGKLSYFSIDKSTYCKFMKLLYSSFYVCAVQGRVSGLQDMRFYQAKELLENGFAMSRVFKTQSKYGFQPVSVARDSAELLDIYIKSVRKAANSVEPNANDPLFLNFQGKAEMDIGRSVTQFFMEHLLINITTTKIRSLIETESEDLFQKQIITQEQRESVKHINGHSSRIVDDFYVKRSRIKDVSNARCAMNSLKDFNSPDRNNRNNLVEDRSSQDSSNLRIDLPFGEFQSPVRIDTITDDIYDFSEPNDSLQHAEWGSNHPNQNKLAKRVQWSKDELDYLRKIVSRTNSSSASRCLKEIKSDPSSYPIFHVHHILNSTRLRTGLANIMGKCDDI